MMIECLDGRAINIEFSRNAHAIRLSVYSPEETCFGRRRRLIASTVLDAETMNEVDSAIGESVQEMVECEQEEGK